MSAPSPAGARPAPSPAAPVTAAPWAAAEPAAILVRTPNWLGDLMVSTSFLRALLARFPAARVDVIVRRGFDALPVPHRGRIIPYDKSQAGPGRFGRALRGAGYSHAFVLPPSFSSAWMAWNARIPWRVGYGGKGRGWLLRPSITHAAPERSIHIAREYLALLDPWVRATPEQYPPGLDADAAWIAAHRPNAMSDAGLAQDAPYVVLAPGAEYGPAKQWPTAHYRAAAQALAASGRRVLVAGLPKEQALGDAILAGLPGALNLAGCTTLPELVAVLAGARLLISNDSGAMHVGAALGVPQIALFGSTNPHWTAPLNARARVIYRAEPCSPCYARGCPLGHLRCLQEIRPEQVLAEAEALLGT
jgi:heptosyltransferase-2